MVKSIPAAQIKKSPRIAIITVNYSEKLAVDAVMEDKVTFVKYKAEGASYPGSDLWIFTVGSGRQGLSQKSASVTTSAR